MSNAAWDINRLRKISGQPLTESVKLKESSHDDDDDMSPAEKALAAKGDIKTKRVDPDADMSKLARQRKNKESKAEQDSESSERSEASASAVAAKKEKAETPNANPKTAQKQERKAAAAEAESKKPEAAKPEAAAPAAAKSEEKAVAAKKARQAREWHDANPTATRKEYMAHVGANFGMGKHYANQQFYRKTKKLDEFWMIGHPSLSDFYLAENREMSTYQWVDSYSPLDLMVFETEAAAKKTALYMGEWKNQQTVIEHCLFENDDEDEPADPDALKKVSQAKAWIKANPLASRDKFATHAKSTYDWSSTTANNLFASLSKK